MKSLSIAHALFLQAQLLLAQPVGFEFYKKAPFCLPPGMAQTMLMLTSN